MKKFIYIAALTLIAFCAFTPQPACAVAQTDDIQGMYEQYLTPQEQAVLDRFEEAQQKSEEAQAADQD